MDESILKKCDMCTTASNYLYTVFFNREQKQKWVCRTCTYVYLGLPTYVEYKVKELNLDHGKY